MGKGVIISGGEAGQYQVQLKLSRGRIEALIIALTEQIAILESKIEAMEDGPAKDIVILRKIALEKRKDYLQGVSVPADPVVTAWCADLTEDLSGNVGTIEIPGERGSVNIRPGYEGNAVFNATRDGQLEPAIAGTPAGVFYNLAMLPGWQKWMPSYRFGTITSIDGDTCTVSLEPAVSSQRSMDVNQTETLSNVPIEYMTCNGAAFSEGDGVIVEFEGRDWNSPKVIGFKNDPKPCKKELVYVLVFSGGIQRCFVWDIENNGYARIKKNDGTHAIFPIDPSEISQWYYASENAGQNLYDQEYCGRDLDYYFYSWEDASPCNEGFRDSAVYTQEPGEWERCITTISVIRFMDPHHSGPYPVSAKLTARNNSGIVSFFRASGVLNDYQDNDYVLIQQDTKWYSPLSGAEPYLEFHHTRYQSGSNETRHYLGDWANRYDAAYSEKIISQVFVMDSVTWDYEGPINPDPEDHTYTRNSMYVFAQATALEGGTDGMSPTSLPRNANFEGKVADLWNTMRSVLGVAENKISEDMFISVEILKGMVTE